MYAVGVDIGGTKIAAGVVDEDGRIVAKLRRKTDASDSASVEHGVVEVCRELAADHEIGAIGLAAPGYVSSDQATVLFTPNLPWRDHPLRANVVRQLGSLADGIRIVVENDANAAGWAEFRFGAGRDVRDMLMLTIGTGLGGAIVIDGHLLRGWAGVAAEVGHMRVVPDGHACGCGHDGCWEQYASGRALVREAKAALVNDPTRATRLLELAGGDPNHLKGPQVTKAAREGDPLALELLTTLGRWIGEGAASVAAIVDPALVVIGGGVADAGELLLRPAREGFESQLSARGHRPVAEIAVASMGNEAGIVGAADLARTV